VGARPGSTGRTERVRTRGGRPRRKAHGGFVADRLIGNRAIALCRRAGNGWNVGVPGGAAVADWWSSPTTPTKVRRQFRCASALALADVYGARASLSALGEPALLCFRRALRFVERRAWRAPHLASAAPRDETREVSGRAARSIVTALTQVKRARPPPSPIILASSPRPTSLLAMCRGHGHMD
jgi:hypothetical protein